MNGISTKWDFRFEFVLINTAKESTVSNNIINFFQNFKLHKIKKINVAAKNIILADLSFVKMTTKIEIIIIGNNKFFPRLLENRYMQDKKNNLEIKDPATPSSPKGQDNLLPWDPVISFPNKSIEKNVELIHQL